MQGVKWDRYKNCLWQKTRQELSKTSPYRVDPKSPKRLRIAPELSFGPRTAAEEERLSKWNRIWSEFPPGVYEHSKEAYNRTDKMYLKEETRTVKKIVAKEEL